MLAKKEKSQSPEADEEPKQKQSQQQDLQQMPVQQGEFGQFADGSPRRMPVPTRADGTAKEDLGPLTGTFGRFNPPTTGHNKG